MEKLLEKVKQLFEKFKSQSKKIKIAIIASAIAILIAIISLVIYMTSTKFEVLFSNLDSTDAKTVADYLTEQGVETKLDSTTNTISVPKEEVDRLKLDLAPTLKSGSVGYELMDSSGSFGMTDEEFKLKKKRMLQGEIEKVIKSLQPIENAKVNITEAESSIFVKDKTEGSAAVTIKLKPGAELTKEQINAIVAVVSSSIENVPKENVAIIDQYSNLLTKDLNADEAEAGSEAISKQHKAEQDYEERLKREILNLLEPIVGRGNVIAGVKAALTFDSTQKTQTTIDPNKVIISQDSMKEISSSTGGNEESSSPVDNNMASEITDENSGNVNNRREEQKTNYDSGRSEVRTIEAQGKVNRLTATVYINNSEMTEETRASFQSGVANAIGIDTARGDQITVNGIAFDTTAAELAEQEQAELEKAEAAATRNKIIIIVLIILAIAGGIGAFFFLKRKKAREKEDEELLDTLIDDTITPSNPDVFEPIDFKEANEKTHLENEIKKYATEKPDQVVEIIKSWMSENER